MAVSAHVHGRGPGVYGLHSRNAHGIVGYSVHGPREWIGTEPSRADDAHPRLGSHPMVVRQHRRHRHRSPPRGVISKTSSCPKTKHASCITVLMAGPPPAESIRPSDSAESLWLNTSDAHQSSGIQGAPIPRHNLWLVHKERATERYKVARHGYTRLLVFRARSRPILLACPFP